MTVRAVAATTGAIGILLLASAAVLADLRAPGVSPWLAMADVAVGLAFGGVALVAHGPITERVVFAAVGGAWLAGSVLPALHGSALARAGRTMPDRHAPSPAPRPCTAGAVPAVVDCLRPELGAGGYAPSSQSQ